MTDQTTQLLSSAFQAFEQNDLQKAFEIAKQVLSFNIKVPQAHYIIGRVGLEAGASDIAIKGLKFATDLVPDCCEYWAFLALAFCRSGNLPDAQKSLNVALSLKAEHHAVFRAIAHVHAQLGNAQEATTYHRKAADAAPHIGLYHHDLGVSLMEQGDFEGAKQSLATAISLNDKDAKSWWILSSLITAEDNDIADKLSQQLKELDDSPQHQAYLGYAAGKLYEDTQSWERAFNAYQAAAAAKRRTVKYDSNTAKHTFDTIKQLCNKQWIGEAESPSSQASPIFIIGQPRSGTTLIDRILSSHSKVHSAGEPLQFAMSLRAMSGVTSEEFISAELISKAQLIDAQALAASYLAGVKNIKGTTPYFIDKLPMNFLLIGFIVKAFPNAKIVHVTRNAADTCFANFKQLFGDVYQHSYDQQEMAEHYVMYKDLMSHWHAVLPGKIFEIAYEDVINDKVSQARKLIEFIGLEWEDACADFQNNQTAVVTASATQVRSDVHTRSVERWKHYREQLSPTLDILQRAGINL